MINSIGITISKQILERLTKVYKDTSAWKEVEDVLETEGISITDNNEFYEPFKNLVIGILSQNTSDRNSTRAYIGLKKKFKITPENLANAKEGDIRESIRTGGLYNIKARRIKELAKAILKEFDGNLIEITKLTEEKAKEALLSLPGIGEKTADVFLAYCLDKNILPVDTNIARVAQRIGIIKSDSSYKDIQEALANGILPKERRRFHELLIRLGRDYCKAKKPLCTTCPISEMCYLNIHRSYSESKR